MVFYRKYRPQTIAELDSEEIRQKLYSVLTNVGTDEKGLHVSTPHAFLFTGPKGLGKTSAARIIAKAVNCEKHPFRIEGSTPTKKTKPKSVLTPEQVEPCNECQQCISITNGTNLDILEIDGASNRGIDEIRDLREKVRLLPVSSTKKIYIIDEVHMLTTEAFNALLKTLEEPPPHVIFILCTTEPQKVPETIISRCFHISFRLASKEELLSSFLRIAKKEKLDFEKEALSYIAEMSDGSFRDGVKILDELAKTSIVKNGEKIKITKDLVEQKYQVSSIKYQVSEMIKFLENKDTKSALGLIDSLVSLGTDMKFFIEKLVGELHSLLLLNIGAEVKEKSKLDIQELKSLIELFTKAYGELKYAVLPQLPLELAVIEWGEKNEVNRKEDNSTGQPTYVSNDAKRANSRTPSSIQSSLSESRQPSLNKNIKSKSVPTFSSFETHDRSSIASARQSLQNNIWQQLIDQVKNYNHSLAGVLRGCSLKSLDDKNLVIETAYKFHKERLDDKKAREVLEKVIEEITGKSAKIEIVLKER